MPTTGAPMMPMSVSRKVRNAITPGQNTKGMKKIGLKQMGVPKITGSLMLKMEGTSVALPSRRNFLDFARSMNSASGRVAP